MKTLKNVLKHGFSWGFWWVIMGVGTPEVYSESSISLGFQRFVVYIVIHFCEKNKKRKNLKVLPYLLFAFPNTLTLYLF